jgi:hypothetical protein
MTGHSLLSLLCTELGLEVFLEVLSSGKIPPGVTLPLVVTWLMEFGLSKTFSPACCPLPRPPPMVLIQTRDL